MILRSSLSLRLVSCRTPVNTPPSARISANTLVPECPLPPTMIGSMALIVHSPRRAQNLPAQPLLMSSSVPPVLCILPGYGRDTTELVLLQVLLIRAVKHDRNAIFVKLRGAATDVMNVLRRPTQH